MVKASIYKVGSRSLSIVAFFGLYLVLATALKAQTQPQAQPKPQAQPPTPNVAPPAHPQRNPLDALVWDSIFKEQSPKFGQATADFEFKVTNSSDAEVVIDHVHTSCGCTVAKLPSEPWHMAPHADGKISVSVNLAGKFGTFQKMITVVATNFGFDKVLVVKVTMPENPDVARQKNMMMAKADPQAIFKGDCVKCHVDKGRGKMGKELYVASCGICHDAEHRDTLVPDLHNLPHPTDYAFWKTIVTIGKPGTMMPAFGADHGGPLSPEQIESLAKVLTKAFPSTYVQPKLTIYPPGQSSAGLPPPPPPVRN